MRDDDRDEGRIFPDYWIRCGKCRYEHPLGTTDRAVVQMSARQQGWIKIRWEGWVCPDCAAPAADQGEGPE